MAVSVPVYVLYAVFRTGQLPVDGAISVFVLFGFALIWLTLFRQSTNIRVVERVIIYIAATMTVYYWHTTKLHDQDLFSFENIYFAILTISIVVAYRFAQPRQFSVTPADFLVIFLAVIAPGLIGSLVPHGDIMAIGAKTAILFYAVELIVSRVAGRELLLRGVVVIVLGILSLKSIVTFPVI